MQFHLRSGATVYSDHGQHMQQLRVQPLALQGDLCDIDVIDKFSKAYHLLWAYAGKEIPRSLCALPYTTHDLISLGDRMLTDYLPA